MDAYEKVVVVLFFGGITLGTLLMLATVLERGCGN